MGWQNSILLSLQPAPPCKDSLVLSMAKNCHQFSTACRYLLARNVQRSAGKPFDRECCQIKGESIKASVDANEWDRLDIKIKELYDAPIYIDDTPSLGL